VEKVAQLFVLLVKFSQKLPKESSHPVGENSPNLATLLKPEQLHLIQEQVRSRYYKKFLIT
jgi:hypothetical protein